MPIANDTMSMRKTSVKTAKKSVGGERLYTYDTKIGVIEKKLKIKFDVPSDMKLGDYFKKLRRVNLFLKLLEAK